MDFVFQYFYLLLLVYILDEPLAFFAEEIFDAVDGPGTNDEKLIRIWPTVCRKTTYTVESLADILNFQVLIGLYNFVVAQPLVYIEECINLITYIDMHFNNISDCVTTF